MVISHLLVFFTSLDTSVNPANPDLSYTPDIWLFHAWSCHALCPVLICMNSSSIFCTLFNMFNVGIKTNVLSELRRVREFQQGSQYLTLCRAVFFLLLMNE